MFIGSTVWTGRMPGQSSAPSSSTVDKNFHIEGISHDVQMLGGRSWITTFQLSPELPYTNWWILGTSELGTDTRLGY